MNMTFFYQIRKIRQLCYDLVSDYQVKMNNQSFGSSPIPGGYIVVDEKFTSWCFTYMYNKYEGVGFIINYKHVEISTVDFLIND